MKRKKYSCDFETTTKLDDCRVWAYGIMEIGKKKNYKQGIYLDEFMEWVKVCQADLYFHNLRFDGEFIVNWLLHNGYECNDSGLPKTFKASISKMGQWYMLDICFGYNNSGRKKHTVIYDSYKKLPFTVKKIAKDFKLSILKGKIDYHAERPIGYQPTDKEWAYVKNDVQIIAEALEIQFNQGLTQMTNGSDSLVGYKGTISKKMFEHHFPVFTKEMDDEFRRSYRGGFTWINHKYMGKFVDHGMVFDVNSLYPSVMYNKPLPWGIPIPFTGEYVQDDEYPLYIQQITCGFELKENHIPTIQVKDSIHFKATEYLKDSKGMDDVKLYVTNIDLALMREHYDLYELTFIEGYKFQQKVGLFNKFIDYWTAIKMTSTGSIKILAKLMLNSLYGKFASNPDVTGKAPYLKGDGACGFEEGDYKEKDPIYTPMGVFITSWARHITISTAQKCFDRIIYCDTDSIHLTGTDIPEPIKDIIDDNRLGYWAHETTFKRGKYIRQKTYMYEACLKEKRDSDNSIILNDEGEVKWKPCLPSEATKTKISIKCAGMPDKAKENVTFDNFKMGFTSWGRLQPKHVKGGVVLIDSPYTIN